jgi:hypothetical protein
MRVPIAARKSVIVAAPYLHKANSSFKQSPRGQTLLTKVKGLFIGIDLFGPSLLASVEPIELHRVLCFSRKVEGFGRGELHFGR